MVKTCIKCGLDKDETLFKPGRNTCKECVNIAHRDWAHTTGRSNPRIAGSKYDLVGQKFGKLTAKSQLKKSNNTYWVCECECGNIKEVFQNHLMKGKISSCGCLGYKTGSDNPLWKGKGEISGRRWADIKKQAIEKDMGYDITLEFLWELFVKQNRRCSLSNRYDEKRS